MTVTDPRPETATPPAAATETAELQHRPGRWIDNWNPENPTQWAKEGKAIASRNLRWSIFAEFLGFVVWQLWSVVVVSLPTAGFQLSTGEIFWLISMPSLVGATLRIPYTFMVPRFGGRNWTIVSAGLLLIPSIGLAIAVSNPATPFGLLLLIAAFGGFGGGNFASSMSNITFFYPAAQKGYALGLNAAGGNLGASVAQFVVPIVITVGAAATLNLPLAGLIWVPLILVAMVGAYLRMDNLSAAKADITASLAALKEPHKWVLSLLYIGTFGSFIGFAGVFPKLLADTFPDFKGFTIGTATVTLAFLGALVGSLARPYGGKLADRFGGTVITMGAFTVMGLGILSPIPSEAPPASEIAGVSPAPTGHRARSTLPPCLRSPACPRSSWHPSYSSSFPAPECSSSSAGRSPWGAARECSASSATRSATSRRSSRRPSGSVRSSPRRSWPSRC